MKMQILKSVADRIPNFEVLVAAHASEMKAWREHMARVKADAADDSVPYVDKHAPYPPPSTLAAVESAVNENDEADYEIVDDGPSQEQVLAARKMELLRAVAIAEQEAISRVIPLGKRRYANMLETDIRKADSEKVLEMVKKQGTLKAKITAAIGLSSKMDEKEVAAAAVENRPVEHTAHLQEQEERRRKISAIERKAAQTQSDIEDLTLETISVWSMPSLEEA